MLVTDQRDEDNGRRRDEKCDDGGGGEGVVDGGVSVVNKKNRKRRNRRNRQRAQNQNDKEGEEDDGSQPLLLHEEGHFENGEDTTPIAGDTDITACTAENASVAAWLAAIEYVFILLKYTHITRLRGGLAREEERKSQPGPVELILMWIGAC